MHRSIAVASYVAAVVVCSLSCAQAPTLAHVEINEESKSYQPAWAAVRPQRTITLSAMPDTHDSQNGLRLVKAIEALKPGDLLEIGAGTYSVNRLWDVTVSGTPEAPLWIAAAKDARVVITRPDSRQNVMNLGQSKAVQFLCLRGLEITGGGHGMRIGRAHDVWIDQCHIHHTGDVCLSANSGNTARLYLTRNTLHHGGGTAEGMYLGGNHGDVIMSESVIAQNHVYECRGEQGDGIEVKQGSWGNLIAENIVHDCRYPCITVYGTAGKPQNVIERNICYRSDDSVMQVQGEAIVRNNLLVNGESAAFASTDHQGKTINLQVIHNTLVSTGHAFRGGSWNARREMLLANNVIYSRDENALHFPNGYSGVTIVGNVLFGQGQKHGSKVGRGIHDFTRLNWGAQGLDAASMDAAPVPSAQFNVGATQYHLPIDLKGVPRLKESVVSGAVVAK
jgi:hypothetical protein